METFSTLSRRSPDIEQDEKIDLSLLLNCRETVNKLLVALRSGTDGQLSGTLTFTVTETVKNRIYMALKYAVGVFVFIWWIIDPLVNVSIGLLNYLKDNFISFLKLLLKTISCLLCKHILKAYLVSNPQIKTHSKIFCVLLEWGKIFLSRKKNVGKFQVILLHSNLEYDMTSKKILRRKWRHWFQILTMSLFAENAHIRNLAEHMTAAAPRKIPAFF